MKDRPRLDRARPALCGAGVALVYGLFLLLIGSLGTPGDRVRYDAQAHHLPAILKFAGEWPWFDLREYVVVSTPGYHLALATVARFVSESEGVLRTAGGLFAVLLAATLVAGLGANARAIALALPMLLSAYVVTAGVWLLPENAAWWLVAVILFLSLRAKTDALFYVGSAGALAMLVGVRQPFAWAGGLIILTGVLRGGTRRHAALAIAAVLPAALLLLAFVWHWRGLVPPMFQKGAPPRPENLDVIQYGGVTPSAIGMTLALLGVYGIFFAGFWRPRRWADAWPWAGAFLGAVAGALGPSTVMHPLRQGMFFDLANRGPVVGGRAIAFVAAAAIGGFIVAAFGRAVPVFERWILGAALAGFVAAQSLNPMIWQRYYEPMVLLLLAAAAAVSGGRGRWNFFGPVLLAIGLLGVTLRTLSVI